MARSVVSWQAAERGRARDHQTCSDDVVDAVLAVAEADGDVVVMVTGEREGFLDALRGSTTERGPARGPGAPCWRCRP